MFMLQFSNINIVSSRQQVPDHAFILGVFQSGSDRYIYSDKGFDTTKMEQTGRQWRSCPVHTQVSVHGKRSLSIQTHTHTCSASITSGVDGLIPGELPGVLADRRCW